MRRAVPLATLALLLLAWPLTAQESPAERTEKVRSASGVDVRPERIGCSHVDPLGPNFHVSVDFVVAADGTVVPETARGRSVDTRALMSGPRHLPTDVVREAEAIAETCRFEPARVDGEPVPVRWSERFAFEYGPADRAL